MRRRARPVAVLSAVLTALGGGACREEGGGGAGPEAGRPLPESPAGQPDIPLFGPEDVTLTERFRFGAERLAEAGVGDPIDAALDRAGRLYVLGGKSPVSIVRFDSGGRAAMRFGSRQRESAAARVDLALGFDITPWNVLLLVDRGKNVVASYLTLGTFVSAVQIHGIGIDVMSLPEFGHFLLHKWNPGSRRSYVVHMQAPLDSLGVLYAAAIPTGQSLPKEMRDIFYHTATDDVGRLYIGFSDGYPIRVVGADGSFVRLIALDRRAVPKSPEQLAAERADIVTRLRAEAPDLPASLVEEAATPDTLLPVIEELVVDPAHRLWVRTHRPDDGDATSYDVFNEVGEFLARARIPGKVRRTAFGPDRTLVVVATRSGDLVERAAVVGYEVRIGGM